MLKSGLWILSNQSIHQKIISKMYQQNNQYDQYCQTTPTSYSNYYPRNPNTYNQYYNYFNWYNQQTNMYEYQSTPSLPSPCSSNDSLLNNSVNVSNYNNYYGSYNSSDISSNQSISYETQFDSNEQSLASPEFSSIPILEPIIPISYDNCKENKASKSNNSRKQLLPDFAVDLMNEWFEDHINNPYPTLEEKEKMAKQGGITIKQVTAWFSNRRNRSQNTKPKRIKRAIEQEVNEMMSELVYNPNKIEIIEKFRRTLLNQ